MLGAGAGERVDRLVVVADDAEVVAVAEPEVEQRLLQQVHVLVLVDGERAVLRTERRAARRRRARRAAPSARADPRSRAVPPPPSAARSRERRGASGRAGSAARDRRRPGDSRPGRCGGSSPTRSRSRGRPPAGTDTRRAARLRSAGARAPSRAGSARPRSGAKWRSCRSAAEWNVEARTPLTPSAASRAFSSPAALSVNVTAMIWVGANAPVATCCAMRRVIVVVLPDPAPARMQTGPRTASAARRCSGFRPSRTSTEPP